MGHRSSQTALLTQRALGTVPPTLRIHGAGWAMYQKPPNLLDLPLEIREQIFEYAIPHSDHNIYTNPRPCEHQSCPLSLSCCNRQMRQEVRNILNRRTIQFASDPEIGLLTSNVPCLHGLDLSAVRCINFEINPFQFPTTIPALWASLVTVCQTLKAASSILHLQIECDGRLPRSNPPFFINEDDLDRGPLNIALLLQPFHLLSIVYQADITILGGPLNDLWSENVALQDFAQDLRSRLQRSDITSQQKQDSLKPRLEEVLEKNEWLHRLGSSEFFYAKMLATIQGRYIDEAANGPAKAV